MAPVEMSHLVAYYIRYDRSDDVSRSLAEADPELGALIGRVGCVVLGPIGDRFQVLVRSIVGQQLSTYAANAIWNRLNEAIAVTPEALASADTEVLRGAGLSARKADYVRELARRVLAGEPDLASLDDLDDEAVVEELSRLRGIGRWSASMFLIIALRRPDVLASGDAGLLASAGRMLGLGRAATREEVEARGDRWRPHRSAAGLYLMRESPNAVPSCDYEVGREAAGEPAEAAPAMPSRSHRSAARS